MPLSFKLVGLGLLVLLVGTFMMQKELRLRLWGKKIEAAISNECDIVTRRGGSVHEVSYAFYDEKSNSQGRGAFYTDNGWTTPQSGNLEVLYVPGSPDVNRLARVSSNAGFLVFGIGLLVTAFGIFVFFKVETIQDAHAETARTIEEAQNPLDPKGLRRVLRNLP
jgi:hypothetical protein